MGAGAVVNPLSVHAGVLCAFWGEDTCILSPLKSPEKGGGGWQVIGVGVLICYRSTDDGLWRAETPSTHQVN